MPGGTIYLKQNTGSNWEKHEYEDDDELGIWKDTYDGKTLEGAAYYVSGTKETNSDEMGLRKLRNSFPEVKQDECAISGNLRGGVGMSQVLGSAASSSVPAGISPAAGLALPAPKVEGGMSLRTPAAGWGRGFVQVASEVKFLDALRKRQQAFIYATKAEHRFSIPPCVQNHLESIADNMARFAVEGSGLFEFHSHLSGGGGLDESTSIATLCHNIANLNTEKFPRENHPTPDQFEGLIMNYRGKVDPHKLGTQYIGKPGRVEMSFYVPATGGGGAGQNPEFLLREKSKK